MDFYFFQSAFSSASGTAYPFCWQMSAAWSVESFRSASDLLLWASKLHSAACSSITFKPSPIRSTKDLCGIARQFTACELLRKFNKDVLVMKIFNVFRLSIIPVVLCPGISSLFPCGLVFACGVIYGMMGLGKK